MKSIPLLTHFLVILTYVLNKIPIDKTSDMNDQVRNHYKDEEHVE